MEDYETIIAFVGVIVAAVARVRAFEKSIITEVEARIDGAYESMKEMLMHKADTVTLVKIEQMVQGMTDEVAQSNQRMEKHVTTLYDTCHEIEQGVNQLRVDVEVAKRSN